MFNTIQNIGRITKSSNAWLNYIVEGRPGIDGLERVCLENTLCRGGGGGAVEGGKHATCGMRHTQGMERRKRG